MGRAKGSVGDGTSQTHMVRTALQELGAGSKPQAIQDFIREKFGKELAKSIISNYKSTMKRKGQIGGVAAAATRGRPAGGATGGAAGETVRLDDLEAVRGLVGRLGADHVKRLLAVLS